jgi:hypothetical protein
MVVIGLVLVGCAALYIIDEEAPTIFGTRNFYHVIGDTPPDYLNGVIANDQIDGDLTDYIVIDDSDVDLYNEGVYVIYYILFDYSGNMASDRVTITVVISEDDLVRLLEHDVKQVELPTIVRPGDTYHLQLPLEGEYGTTFTWYSSDEDVIRNDGLVMYPYMGQHAEDIVLELVASNDLFTFQKTFDVAVLPYEAKTVTDRVQLSFLNCQHEYRIFYEPDIDIFFMDDGQVPYIDVKTYVTIINESLRFGPEDVIYPTQNSIQISYRPILSQYSYFMNTNDGDPDSDYRQTMTIDFTDNSVTVSSYLFFYYQSQSQRRYTRNLTVTDTAVTQGDSVTIPFGDYNIDFVVHKEDGQTYYLMPYDVVSFLFSYMTKYRTFNTVDLIRGGYDCLIDDKFDNKDSLSGEDVPYDVRLMSYNFFMVTFDYFTAHTTYRDTSSYAPLFHQELTNILSADTDNYYIGLAELVNIMDDIQATNTRGGFYSFRPDFLIRKTGELYDRRQALSDRKTEIEGILTGKYGTLDSRLPLRFINNGTTAVIVIDEFTQNTKETVASYLETLPQDIENVVIELTYGNGGEAAAMFQILGFMTDEPIVFHEQIGIDGSTISNVLSIDQKTYNFNWYILVSDYTHGVDMLAAFYAQEHGIATVIGQNPSGGSTLNDLVIFPGGFHYMMPTFHTMYQGEGSFEDGFTLSSIEDGITVDVLMNDPFDDDEIAATILADQASN